MCIICVCEAKKITPEEMTNCWNANSHGAGIGWVENGQVKYVKGFENLAELKKFYSEFTIIPHVLHFRTGTSGGYSKQMTHPFIIDDDGSLDLEYAGTNSVLFHNGVISDWKDMALTYFLSNGVKIPTGAWSDTRVLAVLCSRLGLPILDFIYGKFTIINANGTIDRYGAFTLDEGNYYSTSDYKQKTYSYGGMHEEYGTYASGGGSSFRGYIHGVGPCNTDLPTVSEEKQSGKTVEDYLTEEEMEAIENMFVAGGGKNVQKEADWRKECKWVMSRDLDSIKRNDKKVLTETDWGECWD